MFHSYNPDWRQLQDIPTVEQIDMAPTISALWGMMFPAQSAGKIIPSLLSPLVMTQQLDALYYNALHLRKFLRPDDQDCKYKTKLFRFFVPPYTVGFPIVRAMYLSWPCTHNAGTRDLLFDKYTHEKLFKYNFTHLDVSRKWCSGHAVRPLGSPIKQTFCCQAQFSRYSIFNHNREAWHWEINDPNAWL